MRETLSFFFFFFNDPPPTEIYPLSLPDALPIFAAVPARGGAGHYDRLRIDHLAHHTARAVRGAHQNRAEAQLRRGDPLQAPEENIRRSIRTEIGREHV